MDSKTTNRILAEDLLDAGSEENFSTITVRFPKDWDQRDHADVMIDYNNMTGVDENDIPEVGTFLLLAYCKIFGSTNIIKKGGITLDDIWNFHNCVDDALIDMSLRRV